ncbi:hypothetical protein PMI42_01373 [Bradyrhizobium sp. YR681]|nr:hypothetical protein PMI42_01373 [Bradyrhizobium sp. YR681]
MGPKRHTRPNRDNVTHYTKGYLPTLTANRRHEVVYDGDNPTAGFAIAVGGVGLEHAANIDHAREL